MKKAVLQILLAVLYLSAQAQKVSNIRAEQRGQEIVVFYSLETTLPCEVTLLLSQDNGLTWSAPLKNVSGDVGNYITAGYKQINWKVLGDCEQLSGDKIKFKVAANVIISEKEFFEPELVFVEGGTFNMGSNFSEVDEQPVHVVNLSSFFIGKFEVTQNQWVEIMGSNPSRKDNCADCPVEQVNFEDIEFYIKKLNTQTGKNYRLPTEAEWEFAAKGGVNSKGFEFSGSNDIDNVAWYFNNSMKEATSVGKKQGNELGIFDMSGNVWEWCSDWYGNYKGYSEINPRGPSAGQYRVLRGGSWYVSADYCSAEIRQRSNADSRSDDYGFRLVIPIED